MATMYEMIMDLPLFKGVSKGLVSQFLEKTNVDFLNYESGDTVVSEGEEVTMVRFVVSGALKITYTLDSESIKIRETCGVGTVLGADRLYGISTDYPYEGLAEGKTSIMQFSKEQYVNLLLTDRIYMLNFFNFLSLRAQRPLDMLKEHACGDIHSRLGLLISIITQPTSKDISIEISDDSLAKFGNMSLDEVSEWKKVAKKKGLVRCEGNVIKILSRKSFLN